MTLSPADRVTAANYAILRDGLLENPVNGDIFLVDNGTYGDKAPGDGTFTNNNVIAQTIAPPGSRLLRLFAQVSDAAGLRHAALVDVAPFSVVLTPAAVAP